MMSNVCARSCRAYHVCLSHSWGNRRTRAEPEPSRHILFQMIHEPAQARVSIETATLGLRLQMFR
jgi:hypothetical protein